MNILVIGSGYVGTTTSLVFAELGHQVTALDIDESKVQSLSSGIVYFYEPGLQELLNKHLKQSNITFTTDSEYAIRGSDVIFICVGTPSNPDGSANLNYIHNVARDIGRYMNGYKVIVDKSTVPVGTQERITKWILESQTGNYEFDVVSNPEFLREGIALHDSLYPERIVIGSNSEKATAILKTLYETMDCPIVVTLPRNAELIKYASNCFLATKISFINELARLCNKLDVNVKDVAYGMGLDSRIGKSFLKAGIGYGGSCFTKDLNAMLNTAEEYHVNLQLLEKVVSVNETQYLYFIDQLREVLGSFEGKTIAVLGLAFKPDTDDLREAPSLSIMRKLVAENAWIQVHDPVSKVPQHEFPIRVKQVDSPEEAVHMADAVMICTEWPQYNKLDWSYLKGTMKTAYLFDGRNMLDAAEMRNLGFYYRGVAYH